MTALIDRREGHVPALSLSRHLCLLGALVTFSIALAATVDDLYKQAAEKEAMRDYQGAIALLQRVADDYPDDPRTPKALLHVGDLYLLLKKPEEAIKAYQLVADSYTDIPEVGQALVGVAKVYRDQGNGEKLESTLLGIVQRLPADPACEEAVVILQNYYIGEGHPEKVSELVNKLKEARPPVRPEALVKLQMEFARYLFAQGKVEEANKLMEEVNARAAGNYYLSVRAGLLTIQGLIEGKQFDAAEAKIKELAEKFKANINDWNGMIGQYPYLIQKVEESGDWQRALKMTEHFIAAYPNAREMHWMFALQSGIYARRGEIGKAVEACNRLLEQFPQSHLAPEVCARTAKLCADKGDMENAVKLFSTLLERFPDAPKVPEAALWLGDYYFGAEKYEQAISNYAILIKQMAAHPRAATAQYRVGLSYERLGNTAEAKAAFEKVVKNFPNTPEAAAARRKLGQ